MKSKPIFMIFVLALILTALTCPALANDKITSSISIPDGQPVPIIENNGTAQGTIRLTYTYVGTTFPCGEQPFATFNLGLVDELSTGKQRPTYPVQLVLEESGKGTPVQLYPEESVFGVTGIGWNNDGNDIPVDIYINCSSLPTSDGAVINGQMNQSTPGGSYLSTITTIQVHIILVHPDDTDCIKLYSFESGQDTGLLLDSLEVNAKAGGAIKSTNPGQVSVDTLVVNTCPTYISFDLGISLGENWQTNPHGNPGNAVFTYNTEGEFDLNTYNFAAFGTGTAQGQLLCLSNGELDPGFSFLARVHSSLKSQLISELPMVSATAGEFPFQAALYPLGSNCTGTASQLAAFGANNPAISTLSFTLK